MSDNGDAVRLGPRFGEAVGFAVEVHDGQLRKGTTAPYVSHLLAAASLLLEMEGADEDEAIAALLHDTLEDHPDKVSADLLRQRFGDKVADIVVACSDATSHPKPPWRQRKEAYIAHLRGAPPHVLRVALADKLHNARSILTDLKEHGPALWERFKAPPDQQAWYYRSVAAVFAERLPGPHARHLAATVDALVAQI